MVAENNIYECDKAIPGIIIAKGLKESLEEIEREFQLVIVGQGDNQRCIMPEEVRTTNIFLLLCDRQANRRSLISVCRSFFSNLINRLIRLFS